MNIETDLDATLYTFLMERNFQGDIMKNIFKILNESIEFIEQKNITGSQKKQIVLNTLNKLVKTQISNEIVYGTICFLLEEALENYICISNNSLKLNRKLFRDFRKCFGC